MPLSSQSEKSNKRNKNYSLYLHFDTEFRISRHAVTCVAICYCQSCRTGQVTKSLSPKNIVVFISELDRENLSNVFAHFFMLVEYVKLSRNIRLIHLYFVFKSDNN